MSLKEKTCVTFERYYLSCLSLRSTSYTFFVQDKRLFENRKRKKESFDMLSKQTLKVNSLCRTLEKEFLIIDTQDGLSKYTLRVNSQSKPYSRTLTKQKSHTKHFQRKPSK